VTAVPGSTLLEQDVGVRRRLSESQALTQPQLLLWAIPQMGKCALAQIGKSSLEHLARNRNLSESNGTPNPTTVQLGIMFS
jgi:hypothetical protein